MSANPYDLPAIRKEARRSTIRTKWIGQTLDAQAKRIAELERSVELWRLAGQERERQRGELEAALAERTKERDELRHAACEAGLVEVVVCLGCGKPQPCRSDCPAGSGKSFTNPAREGRDALAAALSYEKARVTSLELAVENTLAKVHELTCAWEAVQANCVAGLIDPRPGVARSSIIRIGEICEEQDYRPRLAARLAAERKELIDRIAATIRDYPNAGGDITIMTEVDKLVMAERKTGAEDERERILKVRPMTYKGGFLTDNQIAVLVDWQRQIESGESKPPAEPEVAP